jgi:hypothetical protein
VKLKGAIDLTRKILQQQPGARLRGECCKNQQRLFWDVCREVRSPLAMQTSFWGNGPSVEGQERTSHK